MFVPSVVAASIICASRRVLRITPAWRPELTTLTKYTEADVHECCNTMLKVAQAQNYFSLGTLPIEEFPSPTAIDEV